MLKKDDLVGAMVYYDGQHNDSRMNIALALTAAKQGATVLNHAEVTELLKVRMANKDEPQICGVIVRDKLTGEQISVKAKVTKLTRNC